MSQTPVEPLILDAWTPPLGFDPGAVFMSARSVTRALPLRIRRSVVSWPIGRPPRPTPGDYASLGLNDKSHENYGEVVGMEGLEPESGGLTVAESLCLWVAKLKNPKRFPCDPSHR